MTATGASGERLPEAGVGEWRSGWRMLVTSLICYPCNTLPLASIGVLVKPLSAEFGWSRATITSAAMIVATGTVLSAPLVGRVVDRVGSRLVALVGLVLMGVAMAAIGLTGPSVASWYAAWICFAALQTLAGPLVWTNAVVSRFDKRRGLALATMLLGHSLTFGLMSTYCLFVMERWGWRAIFFSISLFTLCVALPLTWRFFYGAVDLDRKAGRTSLATGGKGAPPSPMPALRSRYFWQIAIAFGLGAGIVSTLIFHIQPILIDSGLSPRQAAGIVILFAPAALLGRFGSGYLLDRFPANIVTAMILTLPVVSYVILLSGGTSLFAVGACALCIGFAMGAESDLLAFLASRYFGREIFGSLYGIFLALFAFGYGLAPLIAGAVFDRSGSYDVVFVFQIGAAMLCAALILALGAPPRAHRVAAP